MNFNTVHIARGCLCLTHCHGEHEIELSRLDSPAKVYQWLVHLLEKNWVTTKMLQSMIYALEDHFGYTLHSFDEAGPFLRVEDIR